MDSGNSGSLQSSSGGDEEYDSSLPPPLSYLLALHPSAALLTAPSLPPRPAPDPPAAPRGAKKRSRASRRAPTTVLTTDTSNFRAMVQEFTGIPAAPFASSPPPHFPRPRLDLFRTADPPPSFLLRPFPHKLQSQPFASPNTIDANGITTNTCVTTADPSPSSNYQLPQTLLTVQNPNFTFHSVRQPPMPQPTTLSLASEFGGDLHRIVGWDARPGSRAEKGGESAPARGEGGVDSWIRYSD